MTFFECKRLIISDFNRISDIGGVKMFFRGLLLHESFSVTFWFRVASWLQNKTGVYKLLNVIVRIILRHNSHKTGISLKPGTDIGGGLLFHHFSCIILSPYIHVGKNFTVYQGVTIGRIHKGKRAGVPYIGDNVTVFAGSKVLGNIRIGNNVTIGANAVVLHDVPDNAVVAGVPAKILHIRQNI